MLSDFFSQIITVIALNFSVSHCAFNSFSLINKIINGYINMIDLNIDVSDFIPKCINIGSNFFSHFSHNINRFLVSMVHDCSPEILMHLT